MRRSRPLGLVFDIRHAFHVDLVTALYTAARDSGFGLALCAVTPDRDESEATASLLQDRCEALLMLGPQTPAPALARLATRLPVVVLARGGRAPGAADRRRGYRETMHAHGLGRHVRIVPGGLTETEGATAAHTLLDDSELPTAITVFNDRCATGVLDVLARSGRRVPEQISVVGFDGSHLARLAHINLTTIAQDVPAMTRLAVARATDRIGGQGAAGLTGWATARHVLIDDYDSGVDLAYLATTTLREARRQLGAEFPP